MRVEDDVDLWCFFNDGGVVFLCQVTVYCDLYVGPLLLRRMQLFEVVVELVVGILADGTGVEHD